MIWFLTRIIIAFADRCVKGGKNHEKKFAQPLDIFWKFIIIKTVIIINLYFSRVDCVGEECWMAARKHSRQRDLVKEFLMTRKDHPTADVIYMNVRRSNPNISLGTVYRNLTLMAKDGEINRLSMGDGADRFDADTSPHFHLRCEKCGAVVDLDLETEDIGFVLEKAAAHYAGHVTGYAAYFYGICPDCMEPQGL